MIPRHYELKPVEPIDTAGMIMTAAILRCGLCGRTLSGMGGPGDGVICEPCGDELKRGALIGAVKWEG